MAQETLSHSDAQVVQQLLQLVDRTSAPRLQQGKRVSHLDTSQLLGGGDGGSEASEMSVEWQAAMHQEALAMRSFIARFKKQRQLSGHTAAPSLQQLLTSLIDSRLSDRQWGRLAPADNLVLLLVCLRVLLRDRVYMLQFANFGAILRLSQYLKGTIDDYFQRPNQPIILQLLKELTSLFDKLSGLSAEVDGTVVSSGACQSLVTLLSINELSVLHPTLRCLFTLAQRVEGQREIAALSSVVEVLLIILRDFDPTSQFLAAQLLKALITQREAKEMIKISDGIPIFLGLLHCPDLKLVWSVVWCLVSLSSDQDLSNDIRTFGGIQLLLSMLHDKKSLSSRSSASTPPAGAPPASQSPPAPKAAARKLGSQGGGDDLPCSEVSLRAAYCAWLTELVVNDTNALQAVQHNAIYLLALLLIDPSTQRDRQTETDRETETDRQGEADKQGSAAEHLQANALRTLRFLFSMERNRRHFQRLFTPDIFEKFIDVGHYNRDLSAYTALVTTINGLPTDELHSIAENIEAVNQARAPSRHVGQYAVLEVLGSGAFGTVYKVKKASAESCLAMKEISSMVLGRSVREREQSAGSIISELGIMRQQLRHPNVVRYYSFFYQMDRLYIVMEFIEGATLADHFASLKEKKKKFGEERIWNIFFQLMLALRYLHKEKGIVHRDLTPNNVMLGERDKVTITDFGLAKQKRNDCSQMNSVVGTILYCWSAQAYFSIPEIVQNLPYGEKADVWAMGCLLYQMATLHPPFYSSNMLTLALRIVEATYDPLPTEDALSAQLSSAIDLCLRAKTEERPDIVGLAEHIAPVLLMRLDAVCRETLRLERRLERERCNRTHNPRTIGGSKVPSPSPSQVSLTLECPSSIDSCDSLTSVKEQNGAWGEDPPPPIQNPSPLMAAPCSRQAWSEEGGHENFHPINARPSLSRGESASPSPSPVSFHLSPSTSSKDSPGGVIPADASLGGIDAKEGVVLRGDNQGGGEGGEVLLRPPSFNELLRLESDRGGGGGDGRRGGPGTSKASRPTSAGVNISQRKVRPLHCDPVLQLLDPLHRLVCISQLPPSLQYDPRRRVIDGFKRSLFGPGSSAASLKLQLSKLVNGSREQIDFNYTHHASQSCSTPPTSSLSSQSGRDLLQAEGATVTYEQMLTLIEAVLAEPQYTGGHDSSGHDGSGHDGCGHDSGCHDTGIRDTTRTQKTTDLPRKNLK